MKFSDAAYYICKIYKNILQTNNSILKQIYAYEGRISSMIEREISRWRFPSLFAKFCRKIDKEDLRRRILLFCQIFS